VMNSCKVPINLGHFDRQPWWIKSIFRLLVVFLFYCLNFEKGRKINFDRQPWWIKREKNLVIMKEKNYSNECSYRTFSTFSTLFWS
jgi:hypothetical protein